METTKKRTLILSGILLLGAALLRWPDFFGICKQVGIDWNGNLGCYLDAYHEVGIPAFAFAEIIIVALVLCFLSEATRRRWNRFALIFIIISTPLLLIVSPDLHGLLGGDPTRPEVAAWLALIFGAISALLILISELLVHLKRRYLIYKSINSSGE